MESEYALQINWNYTMDNKSLIKSNFGFNDKVISNTNYSFDNIIFKNFYS